MRAAEIKLHLFIIHFSCKHDLCLTNRGFAATHSFTEGKIKISKFLNF